MLEETIPPKILPWQELFGTVPGSGVVSKAREKSLISRGIRRV